MARPSIKTMTCMLAFQELDKDGKPLGKIKQLKPDNGANNFENSEVAKKAFCDLELKTKAKVQVWLMAEELIAEPVVKVQTVFKSIEDDETQEKPEEPEIKPIGSEPEEPEEPEESQELTADPSTMLDDLSMPELENDDGMIE